MTSLVYDGNDHVVSLKSLTDSQGTEVTSATVTMTLLSGDTEVAGHDWPVTLTHDGHGDYSAILGSGIDFEIGKRYTLRIKAVIGTTEAEWREWVVVQRREFGK